MPRALNEYDAARLQDRLWTPVEMNLAAWFDGLLGATLVNGLASAWADRTGKHTVTQAAVANRPAVSSFNGRVCLFFEGSPSGSSKFLSGMSLSPHSGIAVVYRDGSTWQYTEPVGTTQSGGGSAYGGGLLGYSGATSPSVLFDSSFALPPIRNGTNRRNGLAFNWATTPRPTSVCVQVHVSTTIILAVDATIHVLGANGFSQVNRGILGELCEVLIFNGLGIPSTREINLVEGYLGWKWGLRLAADHPFSNSPPLIGG